MKNELEIEKKIRLLEKEIGLLGEGSDKVKFDLEEEGDKLRLDIEALRMTLEELVPGFQEKFLSVKRSVLKEVDPQWMGEG
jgi:hypothetical protein